jgi:hypothetical protein
VTANIPRFNSAYLHRVAHQMPWSESALKASGAWFNPWPVKYLMPAIKWFPLYWPNMEWEIRDISFPEGHPPIPDGADVPWWKLPKSQWPIEAPWEPKWFGAWPASQVTMSEDLKPSIWPGGHRTPPFGFIKLKVPGEPDNADGEIPSNKMRIHTRPEIFYVAHHMKIVSRNTPFGQKFYVQDEPWEQYGAAYRRYKAKLQRQFK